MPLVAAEFGKRKLAASPSKSAVESDLEMLRNFGPGQKTDVVHGVAPRISRLFRQINNEIGRRPEELQRYLPVLEFVAQQYSPAWLDLADLYERSGVLDRAKNAVRRYLESGPDIDGQRTAWRRLSNLCQAGGD